jgi:hypothetical protein
MPLSKDLREFIASLNANKVEYLIVGAFAVAYHGVPRYTGDLDVLIRPAPDNVDRLLRALRDFGFGNITLEAADLLAEDHVIQLGVEPNRIDLLTSITGVTFDDAWAARSAGELDGVAVAFIGKDALMRNKEATGRARDLGDIEELRKRDR